MNPSHIHPHIHPLRDTPPYNLADLLSQRNVLPITCDLQGLPPGSSIPPPKPCRGGGGEPLSFQTPSVTTVAENNPAGVESRQLTKPLPIFLPLCPLTASNLTAQSTISMPPLSSPRPNLGEYSALGCTRILHCPFRTIHSPNSSRLPLLFRFLVGGGRVLEGRVVGLGQDCPGARLLEEGVDGSGLNSCSWRWSSALSSIWCS